MNLIDKNQKEKEILVAISKKIRVNNNVSDKGNNCSESYYLTSTQNVELSKYNFNTVVELRQLLSEMWSDNIMNSFIPVVLAAVFKNSPAAPMDDAPLIEHKENTQEEVLPVYTYTL